MRSIGKGLAALAIGLLAAALPLQAQNREQENTVKLGGHGLETVSYALPNAPLPFHIDGAFSRLNEEAAAVYLRDNILNGARYLVYQIKDPEAKYLPYPLYDVLEGMGTADLRFKP